MDFDTHSTKTYVFYFASFCSNLATYEPDRRTSITNYYHRVFICQLLFWLVFMGENRPMGSCRHPPSWNGLVCRFRTKMEV